MVRSQGLVLKFSLLQAQTVNRYRFTPRFRVKEMSWVQKWNQKRLQKDYKSLETIKGEVSPTCPLIFKLAWLDRVSLVRPIAHESSKCNHSIPIRLFLVWAFRYSHQESSCVLKYTELLLRLLNRNKRSRQLALISIVSTSEIIAWFGRQTVKQWMMGEMTVKSWVNASRHVASDVGKAPVFRILIPI